MNGNRLGCYANQTQIVFWPHSLDRILLGSLMDGWSAGSLMRIRQRFGDRFPGYLPFPHDLPLVAVQRNDGRGDARAGLAAIQDQW